MDAGTELSVAATVADVCGLIVYVLVPAREVRVLLAQIPALPHLAWGARSTSRLTGLWGQRIGLWGHHTVSRTWHVSSV